MTFSLVFVLETIVAVLTRVLLFRFVVSVFCTKSALSTCDRVLTHLNSCSVSNFLGFLGQHAQMKALDCIFGPVLFR